MAFALPKEFVAQHFKRVKTEKTKETWLLTGSKANGIKFNLDLVGLTINPIQANHHAQVNHEKKDEKRERAAS